MYKNIFPVIAAACTWFGAEMGAGTASGANSMNYFVKPGWIGLWLCLIFTLLEGWYTWWGLEFARKNNIHEYGSFLHALWHPYDRRIVPLLDIFILIATPIFLSGCISGTATLMHTYFGMSYHLSVFIVTLSYFLMAECGYALIKKAGTAFTILIIFSILCIICFCFPDIRSHLLEVQRNHMMGDGYTYPDAFFLALAAWGQQSSCINMCISTSDELHSSKSITMAVIAYIGMIAVMKTLLTAVLMGRWPMNLSASIYILDVIDASGHMWIRTIYPLLLAACFITTGPLNIYTAQKRIVRYSFWNHLDQDSYLYRKRKEISAAVFTLVGFIPANFSFHTITGVIQVYAGYGWLFLYAIPISLLCPLRCIRGIAVNKEKR